MRGGKKSYNQNQTKESKLKCKYNWNAINTDVGASVGAPAAASSAAAPVLTTVFAVV